MKVVLTPEQRVQKEFKRLDDSLKTRLAFADSVLDQTLACLAIAQDDADVEELTVQEVSDSLAHAGIALSTVQISKALSKAGGAVRRRKADNHTYFKLMTQGRLRIKELLGGSGNLEVFFIDGSKPRTARRKLADVLGDLSGTVRICDPYYGVRSLEALEMLPQDCTVCFLTAKTNEDLAVLSGPLKDFKAERKKTELRRLTTGQDLHDRYVVGEEVLLIAGHGLKDIGSKQSFMITIPASLAPDLLAEVKARFDEKWAKASPF